MKEFQVIDWISFFDEHHIQYVTHGKNVGQNHVAIACPFCGDDPSHHLSISLNPEMSYWRCWRNPDHRGAKPGFLVQKLLGINKQEAEQICGKEQEEPTIEYPVSVLTNAFCRSIDELSDAEIIYLMQFLIRRKFETPSSTVALLHQLGISVGIGGRWDNRLVFPIMGENNQLWGWTGRSMNPDEPLRYMTTTTGETRRGTTPLFGVQWLPKGMTHLFVVEGPMDWLKLTGFFREFCPRWGAVALLTSTPNTVQMVQLMHIAGNTIPLYIFMDNEPPARSRAIKTGLALSACVGRVFSVELSEGIKDPGDMETKDFFTLVETQKWA